MASSSAGQAGLVGLVTRSTNLYLSSLLTGNLDDVQQAVRCAQGAFDITPPGAPHMSIVRHSLARPLLRRFLYTRAVEDVEKAIQLFGLNSQPGMNSNPVQQVCVRYLVFANQVRDSTLEGSVELSDLYACGSLLPGGRIRIDSVAQELEGDEVYSYYLSKTFEFPSIDDMSLKDLCSAIELTGQALKFFSSPPSDASKLSRILPSQGNLLSRRYILREVREDNDAAIDCFNRALALPMTTRLSATCLSFASEALIRRFEALQMRNDLDDAVTYVERAMETFDRDSQDVRLPYCLNVLARAMVSRYGTTGELHDLDAAIQATLRATSISESGQSGLSGDHPKTLINLATYLHFRFEKTGNFEDVRLAIQTAQKATDLMPRQHPDRVRCLLSLGYLEVKLGECELNEGYIKQALKHIEEAMSLGSKVRGLNYRVDRDLYHHLGRFCILGLVKLKNWNLATQVSKEISACPDDTFDTEARLSIWYHSQTLLEKWEDTQNSEDLDEAIITARRLIELDEPRPDAWIWSRLLLGTCTYYRHKGTGDTEKLEEALAILLEGFRQSAGGPVLRIKAGQMAIDILVELAAWDRARKLSQNIIDLIVIMNRRSLQWRDKHFWSQVVLDQIPIYASIALQGGSDVFDIIDILESGRNPILGHVIDSRTDVGDLRKVAPKQAERFVALRDEVNAEIDLSTTTSSRVEEVGRRGKADTELRACLEEIRNLPGFRRFLLGPTRTEIQGAAAHGPIVFVNVTPIRSDAIIITKGEFVLLPLPAIKYEKVADFQKGGPINFGDLKDLGIRNKKYVQLLHWLWDNCVKLIFQILDDLLPGTAQFHIWWIGIGIACKLPFHVAGIGSKNTHDSALYRAISSYTPTLKILIYSRRKLRNGQNNPPSEPDLQCLSIRPKLLIVTMPSTPGPGNLDLKGVGDEAKRIQEIAGGNFSLQHSLQPSAKETLENMGNYEVVHFACHGQSIMRDPSSSHLLLQVTNPGSEMPVVDKLSVKDVATLDLSRGKLAFLSACSTAENLRRKLWDEGLHLASGFQVAGYSHTVGNLWPADDEVSVELVERFYQHLVEAGALGDGENVAKALNLALRDVSKQYAKRPLVWANFVHFGI